MKLLQAINLTKKFPNKLAVNNISLTINQGDLVALLGPNGAGKSTTLNMLIGVSQPTSGKIIFGDKSASIKDYKNEIGVVFQGSVLDANLTVKDNIMTRAHMYTRTVQLNSLIKKFELESIWKQPYCSLSGGQKRRVDIARALISSPKLLFLDEPSTGLDIQTRTKIWEVLNQLREDTGLTIVFTTHYLEESENADYVYIMDQGKVIAEDTVAGLQQKYTQNVLQLDYLTGETTTTTLDNKDEAIKILVKNAKLLTNFEYRPGTMDDVFMNLTGKEIR
ncbi:ABC transporter ATP-binding protein [Companilactobacillus huachuanensis]|uniref:ABC transporter ATP-binding protein n=1 Tax=Companilactobacillus huachuanensis TaxID=2559914 RepID=A0ABW1RNS9_9LACO|nr:ABC transporter ATP-binding protein [Companilactobacillus huachuanensis]